MTGNNDSFPLGKHRAAERLRPRTERRASSASLSLYRFYRKSTSEPHRMASNQTFYRLVVCANTERDEIGIKTDNLCQRDSNNVIIKVNTVNFSCSFFAFCLSFASSRSMGSGRQSPFMRRTSPTMSLTHSGFSEMKLRRQEVRPKVFARTSAGSANYTEIRTAAKRESNRNKKNFFVISDIKEGQRKDEAREGGGNGRSQQMTQIVSCASGIEFHFAIRRLHGAAADRPALALQSPMKIPSKA